MLSREHQGPRAVLNALDRLAGSYETECSRFQKELSVAEAQLRDYQARLGIPFPYESYLSQLAELRDLLKTGLSFSAVESKVEGQQSVPELAGRIKALKASHTIDAGAERSGTYRGSAEEPVTRRIRRRMKIALRSAELRPS